MGPTTFQLWWDLRDNAPLLLMALTAPHDQEAVKRGSVIPVSRDLVTGVDAAGCGLRGSRDVKGGDRAVGSAHEAMNRQGKATVGSGDHATIVDAGGAQKAVLHSVCVLVESRDRAPRVDAIGVGDRGARRVKTGEGATGGAQKAVRHSVCVMVESRDRAPQVDAKGEGERGARRVKGGDGAVRCPQKTVSPIFKIVPGDRTRWVDADRRSVHCPWNIKGG